MNNSEFYTSLSDDYDAMINFENSLQNKTKSLKKFILSNYINALDLGCGSGVDSIALTQLGLVVHAVDHSKGMLEQAKNNAENYKVEIYFIQSDLTKFNTTNKSYDFIVSLGNTIANIIPEELKLLIKKLSDYLNSDGTIILQVINYSKLPKSGMYLLNEFENDNISIIRKYNIHPNHIDFIIDKTEKLKNKKSQIITKLYPHSESDFRRLAGEYGFNIEIFGSLTKDTYYEDQSPNLIIVLKKTR